MQVFTLGVVNAITALLAICELGNRSPGMQEHGIPASGDQGTIQGILDRDFPTWKDWIEKQAKKNLDKDKITRATQDASTAIVPLVKAPISQVRRVRRAGSLNISVTNDMTRFMVVVVVTTTRTTTMIMMMIMVMMIMMVMLMVTVMIMMIMIMMIMFMVMLVVLMTLLLLLPYLLSLYRCLRSCRPQGIQAAVKQNIQPQVVANAKAAGKSASKRIFDDRRKNIILTSLIPFYGWVKGTKMISQASSDAKKAAKTAAQQSVQEAFDSPSIKVRASPPLCLSPSPVTVVSPLASVSRPPRNLSLAGSPRLFMRFSTLGALWILGKLN